MKQLGLLFCALISLATMPALLPAQPAERAAMDQILKSYQSYEQQLPAEKVYVHTDRTYYAAGDTLWLKVYAFDEATLKKPGKSSIVYVDFVNNNGRPLKQQMLRLQYGYGMGFIVLDADNFSEGDYLLRAYTRFMLNFGPEKLFTKRVSVYDKRPPTFTNIIYRKISADSLAMELRLGNLAGQPLMLHSFNLRVMQGRYSVFRQNLKTSMDGDVQIRFPLAKKDTSGTLTFIKTRSQDSLSNKNFNFIIPLNRPSKTDLQFMPEGGNIIAGQQTQVAFKAIGEDGLGVNVSGQVYDQSGKVAAQFSSEHKGMGVFRLLPKLGEMYNARIKLADGTLKSYPLPPVQKAGTSMGLVRQDSASLLVRVRATEQSKGRYLFVVRSRGEVRYASISYIDDSSRVIRVNTRGFPTGIATLTLFSADKKPLNERRVFINGEDQLRLRILPDKISTRQRDSVSLGIQVQHANGSPVIGTFSMAITDESQVRPDTLSSIASAIFLGNGLNGHIEDPAYYLQTDPLARHHRDLLMLTQGWSRFNWGHILSFKDKPRFAAETDFEVNGRVTNVLNKPAADSKITLFSSNPLLVREALAGAKGDFHFAGFPQIDTAAVFLLQAYNKRGKMNNVGIDIDEKKILPPMPVLLGITYPWFVNTEIDLQKKVQERYVQRQNEWKIDPNNRLLSEVVVTAKKIVKESKNLNGPGESDQVLDEVAMSSSGKKTLMQVLTEKVPGFRELMVPKTGQRIFRVNDRMAHFIFDGMDIDFFYSPAGGMPDAHYHYVKQYLDYYTAEDIRGIEVMRSSRNSASYVSRYIQNPFASPADHAFIEITTRSGKGAFVKHTPGSFLYKPTPFVQNKNFYRPKYPVKTTAKGAVDNRVTLHWEPNIITDEKGEARVSFYTSDQKGTYRIILEGADMLGGVGSVTAVVKVEE